MERKQLRSSAMFRLQMQEYSHFNQWEGFTGCRSQVAGHRLQVTGCRSQVAGHRSQVTGRKSQVAGRKSQVTGPGLQITGCKFVIYIY